MLSVRVRVSPRILKKMLISSIRPHYVSDVLCIAVSVNKYPLLRHMGVKSIE